MFILWSLSIIFLLIWIYVAITSEVSKKNSFAQHSCSLTIQHAAAHPFSWYSLRIRDNHTLCQAFDKGNVITFSYDFELFGPHSKNPTFLIQYERYNQLVCGCKTLLKFLWYIFYISRCIFSICKHVYSISFFFFFFFFFAIYEILYTNRN